MKIYPKKIKAISSLDNIYATAGNLKLMFQSECLIGNLMQPKLFISFLKNDIHSTDLKMSVPHIS